MRVIIYFLSICLFQQTVLSQQPTQKELQAQIQQAKKESMQMIAEMEKEIADAKKRGDDPESINELEKQLVTMKKMLGVVDKAVAGSNQKRPETITTSSPIPPYKSPFVRIALKQPVVVPTEKEAKDRLLWYKGKKINANTLVTTRGRVVQYQRAENRVVVQPNNRADSPIVKLVMNLSRSRQWTNNYVNRVAAQKNSFFDYPLAMMTMREFDLIEQEYNKIADNTIKLPGTGANLMASISQRPASGSGPFIDYEITIEDTLNPDAWFRQMHQELLDLMNNPPPLDFPPPPKHEFDLCYYCDTSLQAKYYREKEEWGEKFTEYEAKLISMGLTIYRQFALLGGDISHSGIPNLEADIDRAAKFAWQRWEQKIDLLRQRYADDVYRQEAVVTMILVYERQKALVGGADENAAPPDLDFLKSFDDYIRQRIAARDYNVIFNYAMILGHARQKALLSGADNDYLQDVIDAVNKSNHFALTMDIEFQLVFKDSEDKDIMRATGYLTTPQKTYVSLGRNKCKWQLYLYDPDYLNDHTNEPAFEIKLNILEGVKLVREKEDEWKSYTYSGPAEMRTVFPSIRIDFCQTGVLDSAIMDVIRYSDQDLSSISDPEEFAKKYTLDLQQYVNLVFASATKTEANRDVVIDITDDIMIMQSGTAVTPTGYAPLDKMQLDYNMHEKQLKIKERITNTTKETTSVILFDAINGSPTLVDKQANMSGDRGYKMEMKKALVKLKVEHEPL